MPLMGGMLDRKLLKDIDDFSTSEPTPPSIRQAHSKHTARITCRAAINLSIPALILNKVKEMTVEDWNPLEYYRRRWLRYLTPSNTP